MIESKRAIVLCLFQYMLALLGHIIYAYTACDRAQAAKTAIWSGVMLLCMILILLFFWKKEKIMIPTIIISVVVSTYYIGYQLHTLGASLLIFMVTAIIVTMFLNYKYLISFGVLTIFVEILFMTLHREIILEMVPSLLLYSFYLCCYILGLLNLMFFSHSAGRYLAQLEEKTEEAKKANTAKSIFLANLSHEIRTPMNAICGMAEMMKGEPLTVRTEEYRESILRAGRVLLSIINDILDFSKIESGKFDLLPSPYHFSDLIQDVVHLTTVKIDSSKVDFQIELEKGIPEILLGDEVRIRQILINLLNNAVKFTERGSILFSVKMTEQQKSTVELEFQIKDTGIGIEEKNLPRLFNSFERIRQKDNKRIEGTGLGLSIVQGLTNMMQGKIEVHSKLGEGTEFVVRLKQEILYITPSEDETDKGDSLQAGKSDLQGILQNKKALIVDDTRVNLEVARGLLGCYQMQIDCVESGIECLERISQEEYDIILMDHMMPEMDGVETLKKMKQNKNFQAQRTPVIAVTASAFRADRDVFREYGFDEYISKPIDPVKLEQLLRYLFKEKGR